MAIRAFEAVVPDEHLVGRIATDLPSRVVAGPVAEPERAPLEPTDGA